MENEQNTPSKGIAPGTWAIIGMFGFAAIFGVILVLMKPQAGPKELLEQALAGDTLALDHLVDRWGILENDIKEKAFGLMLKGKPETMGRLIALREGLTDDDRARFVNKGLRLTMTPDSPITPLEQFGSGPKLSSPSIEDHIVFYRLENGEEKPCLFATLNLPLHLANGGRSAKNPPAKDLIFVVSSTLRIYTGEKGYSDLAPGSIVRVKVEYEFVFDGKSYAVDQNGKNVEGLSCALTRKLSISMGKLKAKAKTDEIARFQILLQNQLAPIEAGTDIPLEFFPKSILNSEEKGPWVILQN